jgi:hypothetical protein
MGVPTFEAIRTLASLKCPQVMNNFLERSKDPLRAERALVIASFRSAKIRSRGERKN